MTEYVSCKQWKVDRNNIQMCGTCKHWKTERGYECQCAGFYGGNLHDKNHAYCVWEAATEGEISRRRRELGKRR